MIEASPNCYKHKCAINCSVLHTQQQVVFHHYRLLLCVQQTAVFSTFVFIVVIVDFLCFVQVYDATNGTRERREWLHDVFSQQNGFKVMFVESLCTDADIVDGNIRV